MKKSIKALIALSLATNLVFGAVAVYGVGGKEKIEAVLNHDIKMTFNGEKFKPTEEDGTVRDPISYEYRTYVPARFVAEKLGANVGWDEESETVIIEAKYNAMTGEPLEQPIEIEASDTASSDIEITAETILTKEFWESTLVDGVTFTPDSETDGWYDAWEDDGSLRIAGATTNGLSVKSTSMIPLAIDSVENGEKYIEDLKTLLAENGFDLTVVSVGDSIHEYRKYISDTEYLCITYNTCFDMEAFWSEGITVYGAHCIHTTPVVILD